jgi:hypothetical protein
MTSAYPDRFIELFARRREPVIVLHGAIYKRYHNMVVPFGPASADFSLPDSDASRALKTLGGMLLRTTGGFSPAGARAEWYAVICREFTDVEKIASSNRRSKLRRGLRNCEVRRMSPQEFGRLGYEVYVRAHERYRDAPAPMSRAAFEAYALSADGLEEIVHHWAVFVDGELAAYSGNYVFGTTEVSYATIKFHPAHLKRYVSYALFHEMNRYYLAHQRVQYVNDGFRSILHETALQEFLEREFGFEKAYTDLQLSYREPYRTLVRATFPIRNVVSRFDQRLRALYELERLSRAVRRNARSPA